VFDMLSVHLHTEFSMVPHRFAYMFINSRPLIVSQVFTHTAALLHHGLKCRVDLSISNTPTKGSPLD
jgi:hypothetical protein